MHGSLMCEVILGICRNKRWARSEHQAMHKTRREIHCVYRENEVKSDSAAFSSNPFILLLFKFQISTISSYTFNFVFFSFFHSKDEMLCWSRKIKRWNHLMWDDGMHTPFCCCFIAGDYVSRNEIFEMI